MSGKKQTNIQNEMQNYVKIETNEIKQILYVEINIICRNKYYIY